MNKTPKVASAMASALAWTTASILSVLACENVWPDELAVADPDSVGLSAERLARLNDVMQGYIDRQEVAGVVTLVARRGRVVHVDARGAGTLDSDVAMHQDAIFRLASMTKPIASVGLMMLYEEGRFQLNDPVARYLPAFSDLDVAEADGAGGYRRVSAGRPITVHDLLTHLAGFANVFGDVLDDEARRWQASRTQDESLADMIDRLTDLPLESQPGNSWEYGPATDVVGRLIEVLSGQPLDAFLDERIFEPLDMHDTHFYLPDEKLARLSTLYRPRDGGGLAVAEAADRSSPHAEGQAAYFSAAGSPGLVSTARDYYRFLQMLLNGGELDGVRLLGRKTVELMTVNHTRDLPIWLAGPGHGFGLGFAVVTDLGRTGLPRSEGAYWWGGGSGPVFWVDPAEALIGILFVQIRPFDHLNIRDDMVSMTYQAIVD